MTTPDGERLRMGSEQFRTYVEAVFREQNRVATQLLFALEATAPAATAYALLESAERDLMLACSGLNEIAAERRDRQKLRRLRAAEAARRAPQCELAARVGAARVESVRQQATDGD